MHCNEYELYFEFDLSEFENLNYITTRFLNSCHTFFMNKFCRLSSMDPRVFNYKVRKLFSVNDIALIVIWLIMV